MKTDMVLMARRLYDEKLVYKTGGCLIAARDDKDRIYCTKSDADFSSLTEYNVSRVPEELRADNLYAKIFKKYPEINAIFHIRTHYINTVSKAGVGIPPVLDDTAQILGPNVKIAKSNKDKDIIKALKGRSACMLQDNGAIVMGRSLDEAHTACLVLNKAALIFVNAIMLGGAKPISGIEARLMHFVFKKKYSQIDVNAEKVEKDVEISNDPLELKLRQIVKNSGMKLLEHNLVQGTWGNTSMRLDKDHLIATPSGIDYVKLRPDQCAVVNIHNTKDWVGKLKPTSERRIHAALMLANNKVNAVIHSHPTYCGVFASAHAKLPLFNDELKKALGDDILPGKYALPGTKALTKATVEAMEGRNAAFMSNHGVACVGLSMSEAFERLRILEDACKEYIYIKARELTGKSVINDDVIGSYFIKQMKKN